GTVEFLVGADGSITFLEVNTRLQVEHPVTEAVTGLDLVELQLLVAAGHPLPLDQSDVVVAGHAIEARIVAEDPGTEWLPSTGRLVAFAFGADVRVDTGFRAGDDVSPNYDSLLSKVISHATERTAAARQLARALRHSDVAGVQTNTATTAAIMVETDYLAADTPTSYLDRHPGVLTSDGPSEQATAVLLLGAVLAMERDDRLSDTATGFAPSGWRNLRTQGQRSTWWLVTGGLGETQEHSVEYAMLGNDAAEVRVGRWPEPDADGVLPPDARPLTRVRLLRVSDAEVTLEIDGQRHVIAVDRVAPGTYRTQASVGSATWALAPRFVEHEAEQGGGGPICPLPGAVVSVHVEPGQTVAEGDLLVVVEAMKMEHRITASGDAVVAEVHFAAGDRVDSGDLLVSLQVPE
ncbi:MAG: acetyl-CoA carboxylase biotin carboxylase subunit, partial [Actinomycetota bacterium]|nr:acetyl-CoA carboxylase biotin carboxylase subunit [Actinomycetota bacterium]